jgi:hypothetical protein
VAAVRRLVGRRYGLGVGCRWEGATSQGLPIGKHNTARKETRRKPAASTWSRMQNNNICDCGELMSMYCTVEGRKHVSTVKARPRAQIWRSSSRLQSVLELAISICGGATSLLFSHMLITPPAHSHKYLPCCCSSIPDSNTRKSAQF